MFTVHRSSDSHSSLRKEEEPSAYDVLNDDSDLGLLSEQLKLRQQTPRWLKIFTSISIAFSLACLFTIGYLSSELHKVRSVHDAYPTVLRTGKELGDCGKSVAEARAAGCQFDPMSWIWVHKTCGNPHQELIDRWKSSSKWRFYTDVHMRPEHEVPLESAYNGEYPMLFTPSKYHKIHCSYIWRKTQAILTQRLPVDSNTRNNRHMDHCQKVLLSESFHHHDVNGTDSEERIRPVIVTEEFTTCGYL